MTPTTQILVIDDDIDFLKMMAIFLRRSKYDVRLLTSGDHVLEELTQHKPQLVILDLLMPGLSGGAVYELIRERCGQQMPVIVCSGTNLKIRGSGDPLLAYCKKPVDLTHLVTTINSLLAAAEKSAS